MPEKNRGRITARNEDYERELNSNRAMEQHDAFIAAITRLADRGIMADDIGSVELAADLLEAVEAFEAAVEAQGGDLMVDTPPSSEPDDARFVLPLRRADESIAGFTQRVRAAANMLAGRSR